MGSVVLIWSLLLLLALTVWTLALLALWQLERQTQGAPHPIPVSLSPNTFI